MSDLFKGIIDMHVHGSPSVAVRRNTPDFMRDMGKLGYRAFVLKDHYYPSAGVCNILNQWLEKETGVTACGSLILNNAVGGLNMYAVDMAVNMGTKVVSFPTISAKCHLDAMASLSFAGSGKGMVTSENDSPLTVLDPGGKLKKEAIAIIDYLADKHPDVCLWTGHLDVEEIDRVAEYAFKKGIKKLYANHPYWMIEAPLKHIREWADAGMYIELNMGVLGPWSDGTLPTDPEVVLEIIRTFPLKQLVLVTDFGQMANPMPPEGMKSYLEYLMQHGVTEEQIDAMGKRNPAYLLSLD